MTQQGITLRRIAVQSPVRPAAEITFAPGLNVISGASETGKSYVVECLDYLMGAETAPKQVPASEGYDTALLELYDASGRIYTITRSLQTGEAKLYKAPMDSIGSYRPMVIGQKHSATDPSTISGVLLELSGFSHIRLRKKNDNSTRSLSFRDLSRVLVMDETRIIDKRSPALSGQWVSGTLEKSMLRFLLTGKDDSDLPEIPGGDPKKARSRIEAQIEIVDRLLSDLRSELGDAGQVRGIDARFEALDREISQVATSFEAATAGLDKVETQRRELWEAQARAKAKEMSLVKMLNRFSTLRVHYLSDIERLTFISEGGHYFSQLRMARCPLCHEPNDPRQRDWQCAYKGETDEGVIQACNSEANKITARMTDLDQTIDGVKGELRIVRQEHAAVSVELEQCQRTIDEQLRPTAKSVQERLSELMAARNQNTSIVEKVKETRRLEQLRAKLAGSLDSVVQQVAKASQEVGIYSELASTVGAVLSEWGMPPKSIDFDLASFDLVINRQLRSSYGKGYRAVYAAGFLIGLLAFCRERGLRHPGIVVMDSPLTTYREQDTAPSGDEITQDVQNAFFRALARFPKHSQIIVFENKEPPEDVLPRICYTHFSRNRLTGRYGFFPVAD